jgi:phosphohistidine phosphatase SixA
VLCRPRRQAPIFDILDDASTARDEAPTIVSAQLLPLRQGADAMIVYLYQPLNELNKLLPTADEKFPTGAMASFRFDGAWKALEPHRAVLASFIRPKAVVGH